MESLLKVLSRGSRLGLPQANCLKLNLLDSGTHGALGKKQEHDSSHVFHKSTSRCEGDSRHVSKGELLRWSAWTPKGVSRGLSDIKGNKGTVGEKGRSFCGQLVAYVCKLCKTM